MIKSRKEIEWRPIEIDLSGPDGNVFVLMGIAKRLARQIFSGDEEELVNEIVLCEVADLLGVDYGVAPETMGDLIIKEMMSSDYEHAVQTFDKYFGNFVILYR